MNLINTAVTNNAGVGLMQLPDAVRQVYSKEIEFHALPALRFDQFAIQKTELGVTPGLSIKILYYKNSPLGTALVEGTPLQTNAMATEMKEIQVKEYGFALASSELLIRSSFSDIMRDISRELGRNYARTFDTIIRDEIFTTSNVVGVNGHTAVTMLAGDLMNAKAIKDAAELLAINNAPYIGGSYVCVAHPHQLRSLRDDSAWINASLYAGSSQIFKGEIGMYENVRFVETTQCPILPIGTAGNAVPIYQAIMLGAEAYAIATALPVELRDDGVKDFQREHSLGWYSIWGQKLLDETRAVNIQSA